MGVIDSTVRTPDGRNLRVQEGGDSRGRPVLVHGGTPTSRNLYRPHLEVALEQGIRLISYDRPGYGGSTPHFGRSIADCAADVRTIADALDIDRFAIWGISGGGPHALACAARLPDQLVAAASLASPAPYDAPGLDDFAGMGELNVDDTKLMLDDPTAAQAKTVSDREGMLTATADGIRGFMQTLLTATDAAVMTGELAEQRILGVDAHLTAEDGHLTLIQRRIPA